MPYSIIQHKEPECTDVHNGCMYEPAHHHGLECDDTCTECKGKCHPSCPAYSEGARNSAFESFVNGVVDAKVTFIVPIDERKE